VGNSKMKSFKNIKDTLRFTLKYFLKSSAILVNPPLERLTAPHPEP